MGTRCGVTKIQTGRRCPVSVVVIPRALVVCVTVLVLSHVVVTTVDGGEFKVIAGNSFSLPCDFTVDECGPVHSVKIYKNGGRVFTYNNNSIPPEIRADGDLALPKGRLYFDVKGSPVSLQLSHVFLLDEGLYHCEVTYELVPDNCPTTITSILRTLARPSPPEIRLDGELHNMTRIGPFTEGTNLRLTCESSGGRPAAHVSWLNGTEALSDYYTNIQETDETELGYSTIDITLTRYDFHSRFECHATNEALNGSSLVTWITVDVNVRPLTVDVIAPERPVREKSMVTLECIVTGARPPATIKWFNGTNELEDTDSELVTQEDEEFTYTTRSKYTFQTTMYDNKARMRCVASNTVTKERGTEGVEDVHVMQVLYAPRVSISPEGSMTVNYSGSVEMHCRYDANPMNVTKIIWYRSGKEIQLNDNDSDENDDSKMLNGDDDDDDSEDDEYDTGDRIEMISGEFFEDDENVSEGDDKDMTSDEDGDKEDTDDDKFPSLVIKSVMHVDKGFYTCQVSNEVGLESSKNALTLDVFYPPVMEVKLDPESVLDGDDTNVTLSCHLLTANPANAFRYLWLRDGIKFEETDDDELVLYNVDRDETGNYSCAGQNVVGWGRESKRKEFLVKYPPGLPEIKHTFPVIKGSSATLTCQVDDLGQPPADSYSWYRNNILLPAVTKREYYIEPVTLKTLSNFTCAAVNEVKEGPEATAEIDIHAAPSFIQGLPEVYGVLRNSTEVSFSCHIECHPECTPILWFKDNKQIKLPNPLYKVKNDTLPIDYANNQLTSVVSTLIWTPGRQLEREKDDAIYMCQSSRNFVGGNVNSTTYFHVEYPPENIMISEQVITVEDGEVITELEVECDAIGFPPPKYYWLYDDDEVVGADKILNFSSLLEENTISKDKGGYYTCVASNIYGNLTESVLLDVVYEPECDLEKETMVNGDIVLTCTVTANPKNVTFEWRRDNVTFTEDIETNELVSEFRFHETDGLFGVYSCFAENILGRNEHVCEITVTGEDGWLEKIAGNKTVFVTAAVVAGVLLSSLIFVIILIIFCFMRRRAAAKGADGNKKGESDTRTFYENLPFHGLQPPPNKPFKPILPDLEYADVDFPAQPLNNNKPSSKAKIVEQILDNSGEESTSGEMPVRPPRVKKSAHE